LKKDLIFPAYTFRNAFILFILFRNAFMLFLGYLKKPIGLY